MKCAIIPEDLSCLSAFVCDGGVTSIDISDAPLSDLNEPITITDSRRRPDASTPGCKIASRAWMKCAVIPEDLSCLSAFVCDGKVTTIDISDAPLSDLNEPITVTDSRRCPDASTPGCIIASRARMKCAVIPVDLSCLSAFVRHGEMIAIDISNAPLTNLNEA